MTKQYIHFVIMKISLTIAFLILSFFATAQVKDTIQAAWYPWTPYQYINEQGNLSGLDHAIINHIFKNADVKVIFDPKDQDNWKKNQADVLKGNKKITSGAFYTEERSLNYLISDPYRYEWNTLYVQNTEALLSNIMQLDTLLQTIVEKKLKLGVVENYTYCSTKINDFIDQYIDKKDLIVQSSSEEENFDQLITGKVNIIIADRITGAQIIWQNKDNWIVDVAEHPLQLPAQTMHMLMHRGTDSLSQAENALLMERFNKSLKESEKKGELKEMIADYLFPVLMNITVQTSWFLLVDYIGAVFFAIAGFLIARENRFDIFGTIVMVALLTSGGGIMRDLLVGKTPAFLLDTTYVFIILLVSITGFVLMAIHALLIRRYPSYYTFSNKYAKHSILIRVLIESIALGAYTIIGVGVAVEMNLKPLWLWGPLLGVITSSGGGILAGALKKSSTSKSLIGGVDPEISIVGGIAFSLFLLWQINRLNPNEVFLGVLVTIIVMAVILYVLFLFKIKSPVLKLDDDIMNPKDHEEAN